MKNNGRKRSYYWSKTLIVQLAKMIRFSKSDPFNGNWETLKTLDGLDANFKRRTSRLSTKMVEPTKQYTTSALAGKSGIDGAQSKEINPGLVYVNGYGMFDVITPPWNLYELAKLLRYFICKSRSN